MVFLPAKTHPSFENDEERRDVPTAPRRIGSAFLRWFFAGAVTAVVMVGGTMLFVGIGVMRFL